MSGSFGLFDVTCRQHHSTELNAFLNCMKNSDVDRSVYTYRPRAHVKVTIKVYIASITTDCLTDRYVETDHDRNLR